ncbi:hypothetical protein PPERSA_05214 [Pseudocohnilembus persalinus]|uniref:Nucleoside phosphatase GDA1/CD39 n=1 Tax=Pseudocohnilembus persalinus TaxID=266149 RepID=A0A0V0R9D5_PSEPJ|nr:hypothetical protein PPERSA_05214 [Pseudocohnilembus persalinus]|eukprot:KRX11105.1 hypothetical protein PPERSA_05214 [Pseudocohnilembus persalinus]
MDMYTNGYDTKITQKTVESTVFTKFDDGLSKINSSIEDNDYSSNKQSKIFDNSFIAKSINLTQAQFQYLKASEDQETCYGLIFDAGSSSTKINLYQWSCRTIQTVPEIDAKATQYTKAKPGIASFADNISGIKGYLQPLIDAANEQIPDEIKQYVPIILFGTAGLRLIPENQQNDILEEVRSIFSKSGYLYQPDWVQVITGQNEGVFMWISLNYLLDLINDEPQDNFNTIASIDLGGASTQIAFIAQNEISTSQNALVDFPYYNEYDVYSVSYLGYGNDQARQTVINSYGEWNDVKTQVTTPCLYKGFVGNLDGIDGEVIGSGNAQDCLDQITEFFLLDRCNKLQQEKGCGIAGLYQPFVPSSKTVYAVSGVGVAATFFDMDGEIYQLSELQNKYVDLCNTSWDDIQNQYPGNDYISTTCFLGLYSSALLNQGYNLSLDREIYSPNDINGVEPSWTLGAMFYVVAQLPCTEDSPLCETALKLFPKEIREIDEIQI